MTPRQTKIIELYREGYTLRQVARAVGVRTHQYIGRVIKQHCPEVMRPSSVHYRYTREHPVWGRNGQERR